MCWFHVVTHQKAHFCDYVAGLWSSSRNVSHLDNNIQKAVHSVCIIVWLRGLNSRVWNWFPFRLTIQWLCWMSKNTIINSSAIEMIRCQRVWCQRSVCDCCCLNNVVFREKTWRWSVTLESVNLQSLESKVDYWFTYLNHREN